MKNLNRALIFLFAIAFSFFSFSQKWISKTFTEGKFKIEFPSTPVIEITETENAKIIHTSLEQNGQIYIGIATIFKTNLNLKGSNSETLSKYALDSFADSLGSKSVTSLNYYVKEYTGLNSQIKVDGYDNPVYYQVITIENILYQWIVSTKSGKEDKKGRHSFFKGITILR